MVGITLSIGRFKCRDEQVFSSNAGAGHKVKLAKAVEMPPKAEQPVQ
jgi:hypothetical protein